MKGPELIPLLVSILIIGITWYCFIGYTTAEGFQQTSRQLLQDRVNPLAQGQNPLKNPAVPIGIPRTDGQTLQNLTNAALNVPTTTPLGNNTFSEVAPLNPLGPRVDNDQSFLGNLKFCQTTAAAAVAANTNPFSDPKFNEMCGVCFASGTPTGVVVYPNDKTKATSDMTANGYMFPNVKPTFNNYAGLANTCSGTTTDGNSPPVLAINERDYTNFNNRFTCQAKKDFGNGCAKCAPTGTWTYISPQSNKNTSSFVFWGSGTITLSVNGTTTTKTLDPLTPAVVNAGIIPEQSAIVINFRNPTGPNTTPVLFGLMQSTLSTNNPYIIDIYSILTLDTISGSTPNTGALPQTFSGFSITLMPIVPATGKTTMNLTGEMPFTFLSGAQLPGYDCTTGQFSLTSSSVLLQSTEPCSMKVNNAAQGPGTWSTTCLNTLFLNAGCSMAGSLYNNYGPGIKSARTSQAIAQSMAGIAMATDPVSQNQCFGIPIPVDPCRGGPTSTCISSTYNNPATYGTSKKYTSLSSDMQAEVIQFCQPSGRLNPANSSILQDTARNGYSGLQGLDAVKKLLVDTYDRATNTILNVNVPDSGGGRKTSWENCFGQPIV